MALTLRLVKGKALTYAELDNNFSGLASGALTTYTGPTGATETIPAALAVLPGYNYLSNGNFDLALNAGPVALTNSGSLYTCCDAWIVFQNTVATGFAAQVASGLQGFNKALKIGRPNADVSTNSIVTISAIKTSDSVPLQGQTVTFSFYAKAGANFSGTNINVSIHTGTGIDENPGNISGWTGHLVPLGTTQVLTSGWIRYSFTAIIDVAATEVGVRIFYTPVGTAGADDNLYLTGVQFEVGSIPTIIAQKPYATRVNDLRPVAYSGGCLSNYGGSDPFSQCQFLPRNGNTIYINGKIEIIPAGILLGAGGIITTYSNCYINRVAGQALAANTPYYVYAFMLNGVMTLNFSVANTPPIAIDPVEDANGVWVKGDDATSTLIGFLRTNAASKTLGNAQAQTIISYYNRLFYRLSASIAGTTTSASYVELNSANRLEWVQWDDDLVVGPGLVCNLGTSAAPRTVDVGIGVNSAVATLGPTWHGVTPDASTPSMTAITRSLNPGNSAKGTYFFATSLAQVSGGATLTVLNGALYVDGVAI